MPNLLQGAGGSHMERFAYKGARVCRHDGGGNWAGLQWVSAGADDDGWQLPGHGAALLDHQDQGAASCHAHDLYCECAPCIVLA